jgi:hypothetical protein
MRDIYGAFLLAIGLYCLLYKEEQFTSVSYSRPNKCFDCEKEIKSPEDAHLAFPTRCVDCEKQAIAMKQSAYGTGPTKCIDCENLPAIHNKFSEASNEFAGLNRNLMVTR